MGGWSSWYVKVTPGKTYNLKTIANSGKVGVAIYYSQDINKGPDYCTDDWYLGDYVIDL